MQPEYAGSASVLDAALAFIAIVFASAATWALWRTHVLGRQLRDSKAAFCDQGVAHESAILDAEASRNLVECISREAREKTQLTSYLAHETRNIVMAVQGSLAALASETDNTTKQTLAEGVRSSTDALKALLDATLDSAQAQVGKFELRIAPVDLQKVVDRVVKEFQPLAALSHVRMYAEPSAFSLVASTDEVRVSQVLRNLVTNAIRFTRSGRVWLSARRIGAHEVLISVHDTGSGISQERIRTLFEPFSHTAASIGVTGSGLGLSLSREAAMLLGGDLLVESVEGTGSTFTLELHDYADSSDAVAAAPSEGVKGEAGMVAG